MPLGSRQLALVSYPQRYGGAPKAKVFGPVLTIFACCVAFQTSAAAQGFRLPSLPAFQRSSNAQAAPSQGAAPQPSPTVAPPPGASFQGPYPPNANLPAPTSGPQFRPPVQAEAIPLPERLPPIAPDPNSQATNEVGGAVPADFVPWWQAVIAQPLRSSSEPLSLSLDNALLGTLIHSPQVRVVADTPLLRRAQYCEQQAAFDYKTFMDSKFTDTSDPVGNILVTGGAPRFIDQYWTYSGGVRRVTPTGAQVEMSQKFGYQDNNSIFFVPLPQGTSRINMSVTQPLLRGAGRNYNESLIVLAQLDTNVARDQLSISLQDMLVDVHRAFWDLYLQRAALVQRRRLREQGTSILDELNGRQNVDVLGNQLVRARAAIASREAAIIRYETSVRNAEARLRALINDPMFRTGMMHELIPNQLPVREYRSTELTPALTTALESRPDITQAIKQIRIASVRSGVAKNELLPALNFILGSYVSGLAGGGNIGTSWVDQFTMGRPTYSTGMTFEMPIGNRAARARMQQRQIEMRQATNQFESVVANARAEVEIAVREVTTTYREAVAKYHAMQADVAEIAYLTDRWRSLPGDQQVAGVVLDNLLSAQDRLADAELGLATALVNYNVALANVQRATGTLLNAEDVREAEVGSAGAPVLLLDKGNTHSPPAMPTTSANVTAPANSIPPNSAPSNPAISPQTYPSLPPQGGAMYPPQSQNQPPPAYPGPQSQAVRPTTYR